MESAGVIIGRFGRKGVLIYLRCNSIEVDIGDLRSGNKILGAIGRDAALNLHLAETEFPNTLLSVSRNDSFVFPNDMAFF